MLQLILGVFVGFVLWSILWVGSDALLKGAWTGYAEHVDAGDFSFGILMFSLVRSIICSVLAGYVTASIAAESSKAVPILGGLLLIAGIMVQVGVWKSIPVWYHLTFLLLLVPMTLLGGMIKR